MSAKSRNNVKQVMQDHADGKFVKMENLQSAGMLLIGIELKEETITQSGIVIPEHQRSSIPLRAVVLSSPIKLLQQGILPGDTILFTAETREKVCIEFQPRLEHPKLLAIPHECIVASIPAEEERRTKAMVSLKKQYSKELLEFLNYFGAVQDNQVKNIWSYS